MKQKTTFFILSLMLFGLIVSMFTFAGVNNNFSQDLVNNIQTSAIQDEDITYDASVERVLGTMTVTVDLSEGPHLNPTQVVLTIRFSNGTATNYTMSGGESDDTWSYGYTPDSNAPFGQQSFNITVLDGGVYYYSSIFNFDILDSYPRVYIFTSTTELKRGQTFSYNITPWDAEDSLSEISWTSSIHRKSNDVSVYNGGTNLECSTTYFSTSLNNIYLGNYYVKAIVTDADGNSTEVRTDFTVVDNAPQVEEIEADFSDSEVTNPLNNEILRGLGTIDLLVNVSDLEKSLNPALRLNVYSISAKNTTYQFGNTFQPITNTPVTDYQFELSIQLPNFADLGKHTLYIEAYDNAFGTSHKTVKTLEINVKNNIPDGEFVDYTINDIRTSESSIIIQEFEDIEFWINVTNCDEEGIEFIKVCLVDSDGSWLNFTVENPPSNIAELTLRARDLKVGQWNVYIYAYDEDGAYALTQSVMSFDIQKDTFSVFLPYLMLIIGVIAGLGIMFLLIGPKYLKMQRDYIEPATETEVKEKEIAPKSGKAARRMQQIAPSKSESKSTNKDKVQEDSKGKRKLMRNLD